jgi:RNA polymerase sigma factor (sigma-70 family)
LNGRHQTLIQLRYGDDLDGRQIAARLGISEKSIRTTVFRIREILRQCIDRRIAGEAALAGDAP